jgi:hypothetical protein
MKTPTTSGKTSRKASRKAEAQRRFGSHWNRHKGKVQNEVKNDKSETKRAIKEQIEYHIKRIERERESGELPPAIDTTLLKTFKKMKHEVYSKRKNENQKIIFPLLYFENLAKQIGLCAGQDKRLQAKFSSYKRKEVRKVEQKYHSSEDPRYKAAKPQWFWPIHRCKPEDVLKMNKRFGP